MFFRKLAADCFRTNIALHGYGMYVTSFLPSRIPKTILTVQALGTMRSRVSHRHALA